LAVTECDGWVDFMVIFRARSVALAGAIAVGVLCEAFISAPAQAQTFVGAFGNTADVDATLELFNSSGGMITTVSTVSSSLGVFQGFISNTDASVIQSAGGPNSTNTSYAVGSYAGMLLIDYFGFNMSGVSATVSSAKLVVYSGAITNDLTYKLFAANTWVSDLETPANQNAALYAAMVKTVSSGSYGSFQVAKNTTNPMAELMFTLNAAAVSEINTQIAAKGVFVIAGQASAPVPEPSTWVMMLAGFAGLGIAARRRAAKRRAAAAAAAG
jgi:PEP-CTERM motif